MTVFGCAGPCRQFAVRIAPWTGVVALLYVIVGGVWLQWLRTSQLLQTGSQSVASSSLPLGGLLGAAWVCGAAGAVAVASGCLRRPVFGLSAAVMVWVGSGYVSSLLVGGAGHVQALLVGIACAGLALAVGGIPARWSGWVLLLVGALYVYANLVAASVNHASGGQMLTRLGAWYWTAEGTYRESWLQPRDVENASYVFPGLTGNGNATGNVVALAVAFAAPFIAHRWGTWWDVHRVLVLVGRILLLALVVPPGLCLLWILDARSAFGGTVAAILVLLVPLRWARGQAWAWLFAVAVPVAILLPLFTYRLFGLAWSSRDCVWASWLTAMGNSPIRGIGSPGTFPNSACEVDGIAPTWWHAHNEILQAWSVGGLLGLVTAVATIGGLSWWAMRYWDRDDRVLMSLMVLSAVLLGFEVFTGAAVGLPLSFVIWVAVAARSLSVMSVGPGAGAEDFARQSAARGTVRIRS